MQPGMVAGRACGILDPFGAWRSLVARTVRVGEVPGSNPGAPIRKAPQMRGFYALMPGVLGLWRLGCGGGQVLVQGKALQASGFLGVAAHTDAVGAVPGSGLTVRPRNPW